MKTKCDECPFRAGTITKRHMEAWFAALCRDMEKDGLPLDGSVVHICHKFEAELEDLAVAGDDAHACAGHRERLQGEQKEEE